MNTFELILKRRSIRKFQEERRISQDIVEKLLQGARMAPSGGNLQPLKYIVVDDEKDCAMLFASTRWAAYLPAELGTPKPGERPACYLIVLADTTIRKSGYEIDIGAAAQNITLIALEEGIGCCWLANVDREAIRKDFCIDENYAIALVLALGYPAEQPVAEDMADNIKYYKDEKNVLHVPKRTIEQIRVRAAKGE